MQTDPVNGDQTVEVADPAAVVTNGEGAAEITFATTGWHRIKAQQEAGFIRSNRLDVCVEPEGGGGCGPVPADAQLRTPPYLEEEAGGGGEEEPKGGGETGDGGNGPVGSTEDKSTTPTDDAPKQNSPMATSTAPMAPPSNAIVLSRAAVDPKQGTSMLSVTVPGPRHLALAGKKVVSTSADTVAPGTVELTIRPEKKQRQTLRRHGKLRVGVKVSFTPTGGTAASTWRSVLLQAKSRKRSLSAPGSAR